MCHKHGNKEQPCGATASQSVSMSQLLNENVALRYLEFVDLRLRQDLDDAPGLLQRNSVVTVDHMSFSRVGSNNDERNFQVGRLLLRRLLVVFKDVIDWRRLAEQIEVRV